VVGPWGLAKAFEPNRRSGMGMKSQSDEMKCPKCGRLELRETPQGVTCRVCGHVLTPGESDRFRLYKLLKEDEKGSKKSQRF